MPCCEFHNRLGSKLHAAEFTSGDCGSIRLETLTQMVPGIQASAPVPITNPSQASPGAVPAMDPSDPNKQAVIGYGKPEYCCFNCPALLEKLGATG